MRSILALLLVAIACAAPASGQTGPRFGKNGGVGAATSTIVGGEPSGGAFSINGTTGLATLNGVIDKTVPVYNVKNYGIGVGTGNAAIDTAAVNAALAAASVTGGVVYLPGGSYTITPNSVVLVIGGTSAPAPRVSIKGDGPYNTVVNCGNIAGNCFAYVGGSSANGHESFFDVRDIGFYGTAQATGSVGLSVSSAAFLTLTNVYIAGFDTGFKGVDVEIAKFQTSRFRYNNLGVYCAFGAVTGCNNIEIGDTSSISNNLVAGAYINRGYLLSIKNSQVEYNGSGNGGTTSWGIKVDNFGDVNGGGVNVVNTNFEGNGGAADLWINATNSPYGMSNVVIGSQFTRGNATKYVTNNILLTGTNSANIVTIGDTFSSFGTYVPSSSNPVWASSNTSGAIYNAGGFDVIKNGVETPAGFLTDRTVVTNFGVVLGDFQTSTLTVTTSSTPASSSATCVQGRIAYDASYLYICVATNTWKRVALASF